MEQGFIKLHRKLKDWEWYTDGNTARLFIHCLLLASHKPLRYCGHDIDPGSFVTGRKKLGAELGLSEQNIRTSLEKLKSTGELTSKSYSKYSIITVSNWSDYQFANQQLTSNQPATNQQLTTKQECKKERMEEVIAPDGGEAVSESSSALPKKEKGGGRVLFKRPQDVEVCDYMMEKSGCNHAICSDQSERFLNYWDSRGWVVGKQGKMKDWKAAVRNWIKNDYGGRFKASSPISL